MKGFRASNLSQVQLDCFRPCSSFAATPWMAAKSEETSLLDSLAMERNQAMQAKNGQGSRSAKERPSVVDEAAFRAVMASVCTPVSVVTALADERPHGTTVSAFASLSLEPPMVLVALDLQSQLLQLVKTTGRFGVNVLGSGQHQTALVFARKGEEKFAGVTWRLDEQLPRLDEAPGWLVCNVDRLVEGGDHVLVLGRVTAAEHRPAPPLTYHQRLFGTHSVLVEAQ